MTTTRGHLLFSLACAAAFLALTFLAKQVAAVPTAPAALRVAVGLVSVTPIAVLIWGMGRNLEAQKDEFQRMLLARAMLIATGCVLVLATAWGLLEKLAGVGAFPAMFLFPMWVGFWMVATAWLFWSHR